MIKDNLTSGENNLVAHSHPADVPFKMTNNLIKTNLFIRRIIKTFIARKYDDFFKTKMQFIRLRIYIKWF